MQNASKNDKTTYKRKGGSRMSEEGYARELFEERGALLTEAGTLFEALQRIEGETASFLNRRSAAPESLSDAAPDEAASRAALCAKLSRESLRLRAAMDYARYLVSDYEDKLLALSDILEAARRVER